MLWKIFPWARNTQTPSATTTPAHVADASRTAAVASSTAVSTVVPISVGIKLPASATVFTLRGRGFGAATPDRMHLSFGGIFNQGPYSMTSLPYEQWGISAITDAVKILDAAVMSTSGNIIVLAHSEGAEVASRWIRQYANDPVRSAMAGRISFVLSGNPLRSGAGYVIGRRECDGVIGVGTPTDSPWAIIDVARRWDGWADAPADSTNLWAAAEAKAGMTGSHMWYSKVNLFDSKNTVWQEGNTTFVLTYESQLQILKKYRGAPADFVNAVRAKVEAGYNRTPVDSSSANISAPVQIQSAKWQATYDKLALKYGA